MGTGSKERIAGVENGGPSPSRGIPLPRRMGRHPFICVTLCIVTICSPPAAAVADCWLRNDMGYCTIGGSDCGAASAADCFWDFTVEGLFVRGDVYYGFQIGFACPLDLRDHIIGSCSGTPTVQSCSGTTYDYNYSLCADSCCYLPIGSWAFSLTRACGNGALDPGEQCDDGNETNGDGCSVSCAIEPGWSCAGQPSVCTGCRNEPVVTCRTGQESVFLSKNTSDPNKNVLRWHSRHGEPTSLVDFGNPTTTTAYALCIYGGTTSALVGKGFIPAGKWRATGTKGYEYNDPTGISDGITGVLLKGSMQSKSQVKMKGKGTGVVHLPLPVTAPVTVQLVNGSGFCWGSTYDTAQLLKNSGMLLKAASP